MTAFGVVVAILWALVALGLLTAFVGLPIWLAALGVRRVLCAVRARRASAEHWWTLRATDRERANAAVVLGDAYAVGRLSTPELEQRAEGVWSARSHEELRALLSDVPATRPARVLAYVEAYELLVGVTLLALAASPPWRLLGAALLLALAVGRVRSQDVGTARLALAFVAGLAALALSPWAARLVGLPAVARR